MQGEDIYLLEDRRYALHSGALVWLFPDQNHILLDRSSDFTMWIMAVRPSTVERLCTGPASAVLREANPMGTYCKHLSRASVWRLDALFEALFAVTDEAHLTALVAEAPTNEWT